MNSWLTKDVHSLREDSELILTQLLSFRQPIPIEWQKKGNQIYFSVSLKLLPMWVLMGWEENKRKASVSLSGWNHFICEIKKFKIGSCVWHVVHPVSRIKETGLGADYVSWDGFIRVDYANWITPMITAFLAFFLSCSCCKIPIGNITWDEARAKALHSLNRLADGMRTVKNWKYVFNQNLFFHFNQKKILLQLYCFLFRISLLYTLFG